MTASGIHAHPRFKLGLAPHDKAPDELLHVGWTDGVVPAYEPRVDRLGSITIGLDGNDRYGDCEEASCDNHNRVSTRYLTGIQLQATEAQVLALYAASTTPPFDPRTGANDNGTDMVQGMKALKDVGLAGRKIVAYARLSDISDASIYAAIDIFGAVIFAVTLQTAQQAQSDAANPVWDYQRSNVWGGHAIVAGKYDSTTGRITVGTWGFECDTTPLFRQHQLDEVWVPIWPELLVADKFVANVDQATLAADYLALTGEVLPSVTPTPPPTPTPIPPTPDDPDAVLWQRTKDWAGQRHSGSNRLAATAVTTWAKSKGYV